MNKSNKIPSRLTLAKRTLKLAYCATTQAVLPKVERNGTGINLHFVFFAWSLNFSMRYMQSDERFYRFFVIYINKLVYDLINYLLNMKHIIYLRAMCVICLPRRVHAGVESSNNIKKIIRSYQLFGQ